jgi:Protein of unknown function (DUF3443)
VKPTRRVQKVLFIAAIGALVAAAGCGSSKGSSAANAESSSSSSSGGSTANNVDPISVNTGAFAGSPYVDAAFTSVTLCEPSSPSTCQTIPDILVDTGSTGLRIFASALTISLSQVTAGGSPVAECYPFADAEVWGPVESANLQIAGEQANSLPIQVIGSASFSSVPEGCTNFGEPVEDTAVSFLANGILGVSAAVQDCGDTCTSVNQFDQYYACPASGCAQVAYPLASQVPNPVSLFASDNNGVLVELPAVSVTSPQASVSGSLIFGIGTQSNNGLGSATVYNIDPANDLTFNTTYSGQLYDISILDTGSNGLYIVDASVLNPTNAASGIENCADASYFYCTTSASPLSFGATNEGFSNGATGTFSFSIGNADTIASNPNNAAVNGLAGTWGPPPLGWDWGLPFFFGRNVFVAMQGKSTPGGNGPYVAY